MSTFTEETLDALDESLCRFHKYRTVFQELGIREPTTAGFSLPRQHAMTHYRKHIENFGAPNGLCSSVTESKHITVVKRPWRRSSRYNGIHQMILTNRRMEKLTAARVRFTAQGLLNSPTWQARCLHPVPSNDDDNHSGAADEDAIHNEVFLAQTPGELLFLVGMFGWTLMMSLQLRTTPRALMALDNISATKTSRISSTDTSSNKQLPFLTPKTPTLLPPPPEPPPLMQNTSRCSIQHVQYFVLRLTHLQPRVCTTKPSEPRRPGTEEKSPVRDTIVSLFQTA